MEKKFKKYFWVPLVILSILVMGVVWYPLADAVLHQELPKNSEFKDPVSLKGIGYLKLAEPIPPQLEAKHISLSEFKGAHSLDYIPQKHETAQFFVVKDTARQCLVATKNNLIGAIECEPRVGQQDVDLISKWKEIYPEGDISQNPAVGKRTFSYTDKNSHEIDFSTFREFLKTTKRSIQLEKQNGLLNEYRILVVIDHGENRWTERMTDLEILPPWNDAYKQAMVKTMHSTEKMIDMYLSDSNFIDEWLMSKQWYMKFLIHQDRIPQHLLNQ